MFARKSLRNPDLGCRACVKALFIVTLLAVLFAVSPRPCWAARSVGHLSTNEATAMGLKLRATPAGPDAAWVELEFQTEGKLKHYSPERSFSRVELEIREGEKSLLAYAALQEHHPKPGHVRVRFMAHRAFLDKLVLTIVVGDGLLSGGAYDLNVKEFVDLRNIH